MQLIEMTQGTAKLRWMRRVDHDQPVDQSWMLGRQAIAERAAPIVTDDVHLRKSQGRNQPSQIGGQERQAVIEQVGQWLRFSVARQIRRDRPKTRGRERPHLTLPIGPIGGKPCSSQHRGTGPELGDVHSQPAHAQSSMFDAQGFDPLRDSASVAASRASDGRDWARCASSRTAPRLRASLATRPGSVAPPAARHWLRAPADNCASRRTAARWPARSPDTPRRACACGRRSAC